MKRKQMTPKSVSRYYIATMAYGMSRKVPYVRNACLENYDFRDRRTKRVPMLLTSKMAIAAVGGLTTPIMWPFYLMKDIQVLEILVNGLDPKDYGHMPESSFTSYLFA